VRPWHPAWTLLLSYDITFTRALSSLCSVYHTNASLTDASMLQPCRIRVITQQTLHALRRHAPQACGSAAAER